MHNKICKFVDIKNYFMKKLLYIFMLFSYILVNAQTNISGVVQDNDGLSLPGATVVNEANGESTISDFDGNFSIIGNEGDILIASFVGYSAINIEATLDSMTIQLDPDNELDEIIVSALGISRAKKSLGYAVQEISGDEVESSKEASFISSLSGKISGLDIRKSNSLGGSVNAVIRGYSSLKGNNQALFVVDGIPISNSNLNDSDVAAGSGGFDYGNAASDINPNDIESISVLKGASAAALYGSNGTNGVILITTKGGKKRDGIGVTINHTTTFSSYDKNTFPKYQYSYGAGYGAYYGWDGYFDEVDVNGDGVDDKLIPVGEDASYGGKLDGSLVYQWNSLYPQLDTYQQATPYSAPANGPDYIFVNGLANVTSVNLDGGGETVNYRFGYTRDDRTGILPNSGITKDLIDLSADFQLSDKLSFNSKISFIKQNGVGRYGTGYEDRNVVRGFRQWHQVNVDIKEQEDAYIKTGQNITWNPNSATDTTPHYFDNPYFSLYENYSEDFRKRTFVASELKYKFNDWINVLARFGLDSTNDQQEERANIGSILSPFYSKYTRSFEQYDYTAMLNFNRDITDKIKLSGIVGLNILTKHFNSTSASTTGGLVVPGVWSLSNSISNISPPSESAGQIRKEGAFAQLTFSYDNFLYIDGTIRNDKSSTLPEDNNSYQYPSVSTSFIASEFLDYSWLSFAKLRFNFAEVANDAGAYQILNTPSADAPFGNKPMYYFSDTSKNPNLQPETTSETEFGIEAIFLDNRFGLDIAVYNRKTINQILPAQVSAASGFNYRYVNAGEMENKGVEMSAFAIPVRTNDFEWNVNLNWTKNKNMVVSLFEDGENILLASQWASAINARKGQPYGTITGNNFVFDDASGKKVVGSDGKYLVTSSITEVLGNVQPDWIAGLSNNFKYKNFSLGFLIDIRQGGNVMSWDYAFGMATGLYEESATTNDKGNPLRDAVSDGGGILLPDTVMEDGSPNTTYASASTYTMPLGYYGSRNVAQFIYDASFVKLRELTIGYDVPNNFLNQFGIQKMSVGLVGRNLWIIDKHTPYTDPEASQSAGNYSQGIQIGALPAVKDLSLNVTLNF
jgi:TonB-linked SusC/RagA family outer membrane protein